MELTIFDVSHGFCALLVADNGNTMMFDCGHNERTGFRPSTYLPMRGISSIDRFVIQNFDQDHVSDLPGLLAGIHIRTLVRNKSVPVGDLRRIKEESGPLTEAMRVALHLHETYVHPVTVPPAFPNIEFKVFHNHYPSFTDTNNLSTVSFVHYDGVGIVFPGDLEKDGWEALLRNPEFQSHLKRTNVFVASHHGRLSGYCEQVFDYCNPDIVIISDKEIVHDTQKQLYAKHARGIPWDGGSGTRYVLTTRADGAIHLSAIDGGRCTIGTTNGR